MSRYRLTALADAVAHPRRTHRPFLGVMDSGSPELASGAQAQPDPDPTQPPLRVAEPTPTTSAPDQIAAPPTPTPTPRSSVSPTVVPADSVDLPTSTPPSERVSPEPTATLLPEAIEPTVADPSIVQPEQEGETEQQLPCPPPFNPFPWLCWPGPSGPSFPVFPSKALSVATRVHWYGLRMTDPAVGDPATGLRWGMEAAAMSIDGDELSRCSIASTDTTHRLTVTNAGDRIEGLFTVERVSDAQIQLAGDLNGQPFVLPLGASADAANERTFVVLEESTEALMAEWTPLFHDVVGLLDITSPGGDGTVEGPGKCAVAGFLGAAGCLATASALLFGGYYCDDILDAAYGWCSG